MALKISPKMPRRAESSAFGCHYVLKIENIKNTRIRSLDNLDLQVSRSRSGYRSRSRSFYISTSLQISTGPIHKQVNLEANFSKCIGVDNFVVFRCFLQLYFTELKLLWVRFQFLSLFHCKTLELCGTFVPDVTPMTPGSIRDHRNW